MNNSGTNETDYIITLEEYGKYKSVIYLICIPIISFIGISGNSLSLYVLQKYPTRHTFANYLKTLTIVDTILLGAASMRSIFKAFIHINMKHASTIDTYGAFYFGLIFGGLLQRLSSTFITIISVERFLAVFFPVRVRTMVIETRPSRVMTGFVMFHILLQLPTFVFVEVREFTLAGNRTINIIARTGTANQYPVLTSVYLFSITVIGVALPLCFVLVSTCCLVVKLNMIGKADITKFKVTKGSLETEKMTWTLIGMAIFFTIISVPAVFIYLWSAIGRSVEYTYLRELFVDVNVVLICMNSGSDFLIYCMTSKTFRVLFFDTFTCRNVPKHAQERQRNIEVIDTSPGMSDPSNCSAYSLTEI